MPDNRIEKLVILGGGTSGWMTAAAIINHLPKNYCEVILIESDLIGTIGVGESTIPHILRFNSQLGIDEKEFISKTQATIKLGIQFDNWANLGDSYIHPFSEMGDVIRGVDFHHYWLKYKENGGTQDYESFSMAAELAKTKRFTPPAQSNNPLTKQYTYSYHIDATSYAKYLREYAIAKGVKRVEGRVTSVNNLDNGDICSLALESGQIIEGDLFVDCSGFRALLIGQNQQSDYIDWSHWLKTDRAVVVQSERVGQLNPYTKAIAQPAGWQWQIPLQHRMGNGHVFSSKHMSDEQALDTLVSGVDGKLIHEPRFVNFKAGRREKSWVNNCVSIGLSSGFLEPLESTSIFLIQIGINKLIEYFPDKSMADADRTQYNETMRYFYEHIRDFIILHYKATKRTDSQFWIENSQMEIPQNLQRLISLFEQSGKVDRTQFGVWPAVCMGQGIIPKYYDSRVNALDNHSLDKHLNSMAQAVKQTVAEMPSVNVFLGLEEH